MILNLMCKVLVCHKTDFKVYRGTSLDDTTYECQILRFVGGVQLFLPTCHWGRLFLAHKNYTRWGALIFGTKDL